MRPHCAHSLTCPCGSQVYPIYDFAHGNEDAIEGVTHSICTLEFENHRALYDWFLAAWLENGFDWIESRTTAASSPADLIRRSLQGWKCRELLPRRGSS